MLRDRGFVAFQDDHLLYISVSIYIYICVCVCVCVYIYTCAFKFIYDKYFRATDRVSSGEGDAEGARAGREEVDVLRRCQHQRERSCQR